MVVCLENFATRTSGQECKHKKRRRFHTQKIIREEMQDAVVGSISFRSFEKSGISEPPAETWLDSYLDEPPKDRHHWHRKRYKPEKNTSLQKTDRSMPHRYPQKEPKFHRCEKHGLVPLNVEYRPGGLGPEPVDIFSSAHPTDSRVSSFSYDKRYEGINFLEYLLKMVEGVKKLCVLGNKYPYVASTILAILFMWWLSYQLQGWLSYGAANLVRAGRPAAHWSSVSLEQFANRLRSFATSADDLVEGFYCDFARSWCHHFEIMCDVRCSFMDKAIQRLRSA